VLPGGWLWQRAASTGRAPTAIKNGYLRDAGLRLAVYRITQRQNKIWPPRGLRYWPRPFRAGTQGGARRLANWS
jgi:hypothetical protein